MRRFRIAFLVAVALAVMVLVVPVDLSRAPRTQTGKLALNTQAAPRCKTLFDTANLAATDDVPDLWIFRDASTVVNAKCISTGGTSITVTIEDDTGNDLTTSCVCTTSLVDCTLTANDAFAADERADWTTVSVSGSTTSATMCLFSEVD